MRWRRRAAAPFADLSGRAQASGEADLHAVLMETTRDRLHQETAPVPWALAGPRRLAARCRIRRRGLSARPTVISTGTVGAKIRREARGLGVSPTTRFRRESSWIFSEIGVLTGLSSLARFLRKHRQFRCLSTAGWRSCYFWVGVECSTPIVQVRPHCCLPPIKLYGGSGRVHLADLGAFSQGPLREQRNPRRDDDRVAVSER